MSSELEKNALELIQQGKKALEGKKPEHLKGAQYFIQAGEIYKQLNSYDESINCYNSAFTSFQKLNDNFKMAECYIRNADNYILLNQNDKTISCLNSAIDCYIKEKKYEIVFKIYIKYANDFIEKKNFEVAENILLICLVNFLYNTDYIYYKIYGEICLSKYLNILCLNKKYKEAIKILKEHINVNLSYEKDDFYKINQMYIKLAIIKILNNQQSEVEDIIKDMSKLKYENVNEDINDLRALINSLDNLNKIQFDYCVYGAYLIFEENLLSNLKEFFNEKKKMIENK